MVAQPTALRSLFQQWGADFHVLHEAEIPLRVSEAGQEYQAAREGVVLFDGGDRGWIEITGSDTASFLQRVLTSDVEALVKNAGQWSAMLDGKGHWISDLLLFRASIAESQESYNLDLPFSKMDTLCAKLDQYHFGEEITWTAKKLARIIVAGPKASEMLQGLGFSIPFPGKISPSFPKIPFGVCVQDDVWIVNRPDRGIPCWEILASIDRIEPLAQRLKENGAVPSGFVVQDILRVEAGIPRFETDFSTESTLPEAEEWHRASLTKGCYAGQEVIAKVNTYGEAPRRLCSLIFESGTQPLHGAEIQNAEGKKVGTVTSWIWSPKKDIPLGLGTLKRSALRADKASPLCAVKGDLSVPLQACAPEKVLG